MTDLLFTGARVITPDEDLPAGGNGPVFAFLHGRHGRRPMLLRTVDGSAPDPGRKVLERGLQRADGIAEPSRQPMRGLVRVQEDVVESQGFVLDARA